MVANTLCFCLGEMTTTCTAQHITHTHFWFSHTWALAQMFYAPRMIYNGIYWFVLPASLVIFNDIMAYVFGRAFGRMLFKCQFLAISPNKTWEGFLGAMIVTLPFS